MSLKVWLPLNGTLENKGLLNDNFTINTAPTYIANGKIGQAMALGSVSMSATSMQDIFKNNTFSICFWLYVNADTGNTSKRAMFFGNNSPRRYSLFQYPSCNDLHWSWANDSSNNISGVYSGAFPSYQWTHCAITYDSQKLTIYLNGIQARQVNITYSPVSLNYTTVLFSNCANDGRYLNDYRIYDHCLSAAEVHEISQGLVLHYKLDGFQGGYGNPNLVAGSNTASTSTNKWGASSSVGGNTSTIVQDENGHTCVQVARDATTQSSWDYLYYSNLLKTLIKTNTTYTISFDCKPSVDGSIGFTGFMNGNATNSMTSSTTTIQGTCIANQWNHMIYRSTTKTSFNDITVSGQVVYFSRSASLRGVNTTVLFKNIKVEEGNIDTPWCPADSELTIDRTHIQDSSGYGHNGSILNAPTISSDTSRYSSSLNLNGTTDGILIENLPLSNIINTEVTYSFWIKPNGENGARSIYFGSYSSTSWSIEKTTGNVLRSYWNGSPDEACSGATITDGIWQHVCITKKGTSDIKVYINGVQKWSSTATHNNLTFPTTFRIGRDIRSNDGTPYKGLISDFRIYATALSADDIKQLYQVGAKVDNLGNWHTFEFTENSSIAKVKKTGITQANEVHDNLLFRNKAQIIKNNAKVLIQGDLNIITTKSGHTKTGSMPSLPAATVQSLAGKTVRLVYDVCASGARSSAEQGQTSYSYTRYGIHGSCTMNSDVSYPFASELNYSGNSKHAIQTWTIPTGKSSYGALYFTIQNFDKPASTNNDTWFITNVRLELIEGTAEDIIGTNLIEL